MAHHIIYLPGLGDQIHGGIQKKAIDKWVKHDVVPHYQNINWPNNESFESKLNKVAQLIDELAKQNHKISLVGASGGGTMAISVYIERRNRISSVVFVCGKINHLGNIQQKYFRKNPAYKECVAHAKSKIPKLTYEDKQKMISLYPIFDEVVATKDAKLAGTRNKMIFSVFHAPSIYLAITLYKKTIIQFLKKKETL